MRKGNRERFSGAQTAGNIAFISLCGIVLLSVVSAMPGEFSQAKHDQRKQGGEMLVLSLSNANRPLLSNDGQRLVVSPEVGVTEVYDVTTGRKLQTFRVPNSGEHALSADGKRVGIWATETAGNGGQHYSGKAVFWLFDVDSGKELRHNDAVIFRDGKRVGFLHALDKGENVSADLQWVANLGPNQNTVPGVTLRNLETQQSLREFSFGGHTEHGIDGTVVMTPDARVIAATRRDLYGTNQKQTVVWDATSGRELLRFPFAAISVSLSQDGRRLALNASESDNYVIEVWSLQNGRRISEVGLEFGPSRHIIGGGVLSPDGKLLATKRKNYVLLWDTESGKLMAAHPASTASDDDIKSVVFSGNGQFIATGSMAEQVRVWRLSELLKQARVSNMATLLRLLH
jgi:WD40 repeat protein